MKKKILMVGILAFAVFLVACGEESSQAIVNTTPQPYVNPCEGIEYCVLLTSTDGGMHFTIYIDAPEVGGEAPGAMVEGVSYVHGQETSTPLSKIGSPTVKLAGRSCKKHKTVNEDPGEVKIVFNCDN